MPEFEVPAPQSSFSNPLPPTPPTPPISPLPPEPKTNWFKIILLSLLGLAVVLGLVALAFWYGTQKSSTTEPTEIPTTANTSTPETESTTKTKTYTDEEYGFSFSYPQGWEMTTLPDVDQRSGLSLSNIATGHAISVRVWRVTGFGYCYQYGDNKEIIVGGKTAETADGVGNANAEVCDASEEDVSGLGDTFVLIPLGSDDKNLPANQIHISYRYPLGDIALAKSNLNQILSTFQFTTPVADVTVDWKSISDTQVGIFFKYPEDLLSYSNTPIIAPDHSSFSFEAFNNEEKRDHLMLQEEDLELDIVVYKPAGGTVSPYLSAIEAADNSIVTQPFPGISGSYTKVKTITDADSQRAIIYAEPENAYAEYDAIIIDSNNNVATIRLMTGSHDKREELLPLLDQILSTFQFLN